MVRGKHMVEWTLQKAVTLLSNVGILWMIKVPLTFLQSSGLSRRKLLVHLKELRAGSVSFILLT